MTAREPAPVPRESVDVQGETFGSDGSHANDAGSAHLTGTAEPCSFRCMEGSRAAAPTEPDAASLAPPADRSWPRGAAPAAAILAATVLGLVEASQVQYDRAVQGAPITWEHALIHGLPRWYAWAVLLPGILAVTRAIHRRARSWTTALPLHTLAGIAFTLLQVFLFSTVSTALHGEPGLVQHLRPAFLKYIGLTFLGGLVTYTLLVLGWHAWRLYREGRRREREAARLELRAAELKALLAEAHLGQLQSQLQPHFLFNALHTLSALIRSGDVEDGVRMTQRLSELLRRVLRYGDRPEIPLATELRLARSYLEIQRIRFGERLTVEVEAGDDVRDALVPTLILQPLLENAVTHGIERSSASGRISVSAVRDGDALVVRVADDGPGPTPAAGSGGGVGLENSRARLEKLYGEDARLELRAAEGGGAEARLEVPFHTSTAVPGSAVEDEAKTG